ncbi:MAG: deoxyribodipyrimidine photo-lyase/cryptochrome family protein [Verrucomicrobiota bacterium]
MEIVWFKRDLRVTDHAPLTRALGQGPTAALFVYEDELLFADDFAGRHLHFLNDCLQDLREELASLQVPLLLRRGEVTQVLTRLAPTRLWSHQETGNALTYRRDQRVAQWCRENHVPWQESPQTGVIRRLENRDGWAKRWARRMNEPVLPPPTPQALAAKPSSWEPGEQLSGQDLGLAPDPLQDRQPGGRPQALALLDSFLLERGQHYSREMSSPVTAYEACSRLSPHFAFGSVSIREAYQTVTLHRAELYRRKAEGEAMAPGWFSALKSFLARLRWHCHFMQKLEDEPEIEFRNFSRAYDGLREPHWSEERFQAWVEGRTGYPLVDACMRALTATGWLNFRMRAMLMSFASYHLWLHWRRTGLHLAKLFVDFEPGIHWSQSQMQSGTTGINTLRVYSPTKQLLDQDPEGVFVRRWVPELAQVPDRYLAEPHTMPELEQQMAGCVIGRDYPAPIVDHQTAYREAQQKMRSVRSRRESRQEADAVQAKHGSRKRTTSKWR